MSVFRKILEKLGLRKDKEEEKPAIVGTKDVVQPKPSSGTAKQVPTGKPTGQAPTSERGVRSTTSVGANKPQPGMAVKESPNAMAEVDVKNMLEQKAKGTGLNWKQSISDLLFLLDMDNSYDARVELAKELNAPQEVMGDSARMNTWLHKEVLRKIAENGGNIPKELLD